MKGTPPTGSKRVTAAEAAVLIWLAVATILGATSPLAWLAIDLAGGQP